MIQQGKKREGFLGQRMVVLPKNVRSEIQNNPIINSLYVTDVGYYPYAEHHYRKRESGSNEFILIYCLEGHGWIELETERHELVPNSYFIIPRKTAHKYGAKKEDPWAIYWIHFTGINAKYLYDKYRNANASVEDISMVVQIPFEEQRIEYFNGIISLLESGYSREIVEYVNISVWQLLSSFIYNDIFSKVRYQNNETNIVDRAINYMKDNITESISVDELANYLNYSSSYIYASFKKETGYSPINYFNHLKIQRACQFLSFTDLSIKEISFELGFKDPFYFSRLFKQLMELSPTDYRTKL